MYLFQWNNFLATAVIVLLICQLSSGKIAAVAVFRRDEVNLHKYSAVLAAIEPFRMQLHDEIKKSLNPLNYAFQKMKGTVWEDPDNGLRNDNRDVDMAYTRYEGKINDIIRSYEMNVQTFNSMSTKISEEPSLKKKIILQAYYYRTAADLESLIKPKLPILPADKTVSNLNTNVIRDESLFVSSQKDTSEFTRFCKALKTIENERIKSREKLQSDLGIRTLPPRMCDPDIQPIMCKQVQVACQMFPSVVSKVVNYYGIPDETFDQLFEKHESDMIYRYRVSREINRLEKSKRK